MKRALAVLGASAFAAAVLVGMGGVAHADPYNCLEWGEGGSWAVRCSGSGMYRAVVYCDEDWPWSDYQRYGNAVRPDGLSVASCDAGDPRTGGSFQILEH